MREVITSCRSLTYATTTGMAVSPPDAVIEPPPPPPKNGESENTRRQLAPQCSLVLLPNTQLICLYQLMSRCIALLSCHQPL